jgi:hypothetical protein
MKRRFRPLDGEKNMGYRHVVVWSLVALCFGAFFACAGLYLAPKPGDPITPWAVVATPVSLAFVFISILGGAVANALKEQAQRIEHLERLLAERSPGFIAENPVTR